MSQQKSSPERSARATTDGALRVDSRELLQGRRQLIIVHGGHEYRLQVTNSGKLILTK